MIFNVLKNNILIKNYISENLEFLIKNNNVSMDEFGAQFELKRGIVSQYIRRISLPKLETIQRICIHYEISIDNFVNKNLAELQGNFMVVNDAPEGYGIIDLKYVELLEKNISDKDKLIQMYEDKLGLSSSKSETA